MRKFLSILGTVLLFAALFLFALAPIALAADGSDGATSASVVQLWGLVIGLFLPFVLGLLMKHSWANWLKFLIVLVISAIAGTISLLVAGDLREYALADWALLLAAIVAASQVTFHWFIDRIPGLKEWLYSQFIRD